MTLNFLHILLMSNMIGTVTILLNILYNDDDDDDNSVFDNAYYIVGSVI
jgi:hypothetical protein